jgi:hypothetical protein
MMVEYCAMNSDTYTKASLLIIALLLVPAAIRPILSPEVTAIAQGSNAAKSVSVRWEYKLVNIERQPNAFALGDFNQLAEDGQSSKGDWFSKAQQLGSQGWELVSVTPMANSSGRNFAGSTTEVMFLFKRPRP